MVAQMNIKTAKAIPLSDILLALGCEEDPRSKPHDRWFKPPWRPQETKASFHINVARNVWYDQGEGIGGTVIDFAERHLNTRDVPEVLRWLDSLNIAPGPVREPMVFSKATTDIAAENIEVKPLGERSKLYLRQRGIDPRLAIEMRIREVHYDIAGQHYFGAACCNDSFGWEVRNPAFKGSVAHKDISTCCVAPGPYRKDVAVFESWIDMLSAQQANLIPDNVSWAIVLNGVGQKERALARIKQLAPDVTHLFLDNDDAGEKTKDWFRERLQAVDESWRYQGFKDVNAMLTGEGRGR